MPCLLTTARRSALLPLLYADAILAVGAAGGWWSIGVPRWIVWWLTGLLIVYLLFTVWAWAYFKRRSPDVLGTTVSREMV